MTGVIMLIVIHRYIYLGYMHFCTSLSVFTGGRSNKFSKCIFFPVSLCMNQTGFHNQPKAV